MMMNKPLFAKCKVFEKHASRGCLESGQRTTVRQFMSIYGITIDWKEELLACLEALSDNQ